LTDGLNYVHESGGVGLNSLLVGSPEYVEDLIAKQFRANKQSLSDPLYQGPALLNQVDSPIAQQQAMWLYIPLFSIWSILTQKDIGYVAVALRVMSANGTGIVTPLRNFPGL
jgi:hypothetical protein